MAPRAVHHPPSGPIPHADARERAGDEERVCVRTARPHTRTREGLEVPGEGGRRSALFGPNADDDHVQREDGGRRPWGRFEGCIRCRAGP